MPADTNKPKRYVVTYDGGFIAWQYREAKDSDKGERIWYRECDYAALAAENERLRKAGDLMARHFEYLSEWNQNDDGSPLIHPSLKAWLDAKQGGAK